MSSPAAAIHPADGTALDVNLRPVATGCRGRCTTSPTRSSRSRSSRTRWGCGSCGRSSSGRRPASSCSALRSSSASASTRSCRRSSAPCPTGAAGGCRCCSCSPLLCVGPTSLIALGGPLGGLILFTIANFAYHVGAHLLRRVAQAREHAGARGRTSGIGVGIGYCGTVFVGLILAFATSRSTCGSCSRPSCTACSRSRSSSSSRSRATPMRRRSPPATSSPPGPAAADDRPRAPGPGPAAVPARPVLLLGRGQHGDRRDEHRRGAGGRLHRADDGADPPAADDRRDPDVVRVGRAVGPRGAAGDADRGPHQLGRRPDPRRAVAGDDGH